MSPLSQQVSYIKPNKNIWTQVQDRTDLQSDYPTLLMHPHVHFHWCYIEKASDRTPAPNTNGAPRFLNSGQEKGLKGLIN